MKLSEILDEKTLADLSVPLKAQSALVRVVVDLINHIRPLPNEVYVNLTNMAEKPKPDLQELRGIILLLLDLDFEYQSLRINSRGKLKVVTDYGKVQTALGRATGRTQQLEAVLAAKPQD